jgi:RND family efflux transporter MFP subunit
MSKRTRWILVAVVALVLLALAGRMVMARKNAAALATPAASAPAASAAATQSLELTPGDITTVGPAELVGLLSVNGGLRAVQSAVVKAKVAAELKSLSVREGDRVSAGQLIGQLDATEVRLRLKQAEDQAAAAQSQLDIAQRTLDNNKALVNQGFISRTALETSVSSASGAQSSLQAAQAAAAIARKAVADSEVRAPIAGLVSQRLVQPGERVPLDGRIVEIVDLSRIELEAAVAPEDVVQLRVGQTARVEVDGLAAPIAAKVVRINPAAQAGTRTVSAYLELQSGPHMAGLRQGLFARGAVELQRRQALVVPASAVRFDQAKPYVLAVVDGLAKALPVTLGLRGDARIGAVVEPAVEVTAGVAAGTTVLRGTVGSLREGTRLSLPGRAATATAVPAPAASAASR